MSFQVFAESSCPQPSSPDEATQLASQMFDQGEELYRRNDCLALERFQCSFNLFEHPNTMYNVGRTAELCDRVDLALLTYRRFLENYPDDAARERVENRLRNLDGNTEPMAEPASVEENEDLEQQTPESPPDDLPTEGPEGHGRIEIDDASDGEAAPRFVYAQTESQWPEFLGWSLLTIGGLLVVTGGAFYLAALFVNNDFQALRTSEGATPTELRDLRNRGQSFQLAGAVLLGTGAAALLTSMIVLLVRKVRRENRPESSLALQPWVRALAAEAQNDG